MGMFGDNKNLTVAKSLCSQEKKQGSKLNALFCTHVVLCKSYNLLTSYVAKGPLGSVDELAKHCAAKGNLCYKGKVEKSWHIPCTTRKMVAS